jgi:hypothetical protein
MEETPDQSMAEKLQWLMDRTAISELLYSFARALDTRDYRAYWDSYAEGGHIVLPDPEVPGATFLLPKDQMQELVPRSLGAYTATHHISTNHQITIDGNKATSRSYLQAVHVGETPTTHWSAGGWYDSEYVRTPAGWKFFRVQMTPVWLEGQIAKINPR